MSHCFELEGVRRFDDRAKAYAAARPGYPDAALEFLLAGCAAHPGGVIIDVGAGTGVSSNLLSRCGRTIIALEPNRSMIREHSPVPAVKWAAGRAESLPFKDAAACLVTSFNAFHWFKPAAFLAEAHRVLAPGGKLGLAWNDWDLGDAFTADFFKIVRSHAADHPPENRELEVSPLYNTAFFGNVLRDSFENVHVLNLESMRLRAQSTSYVPREGAAWEEVDRELTALFQRFQDPEGTVRHRYHTAVFLADRR